MRYHALASDYDGTLATHGRLVDTTVDALRRLRATGRRLLLVTGRQIEDLLTVCPEVDLRLFDLVVAENGAVVYAPATRAVRALGEPPPAALIAQLRQRGVDPLSVGHVIVATVTPHESDALESIRTLGLEMQVIFNKGAVMLLPSGINKATGLLAALGQLGLSPHNVVAVGDAENDHALLAACECAVAVANALPMLKDRADRVTTHPHGAGVSELIDGLIESDLAELAPRLARHDVPLGTDARGMSVAMPAYGASMLLAASPISDAAPATFVAGLIERIAQRGYQHCLVDFQGRHGASAGTVALGDAHHAPTITELLEVLGDPRRNAVVNLRALPPADRPPFFESLLARLRELRARTGRPHFIVVDELGDLLPAEDPAAVDHDLGHDLAGLILVTSHPDQVSPGLLAAVDLVVAAGASADETMRGFARALGDAASGVLADQPPEEDVAADVDVDAAVVWWRGRERHQHQRQLPFRLRGIPGASRLSSTVDALLETT